VIPLMPSVPPESQPVVPSSGGTPVTRYDSTDVSTHSSTGPFTTNREEPRKSDSPVIGKVETPEPQFHVRVCDAAIRVDAVLTTLAGPRIPSGGDSCE